MEMLLSVLLFVTESAVKAQRPMQFSIAQQSEHMVGIFSLTWDPMNGSLAIGGCHGVAIPVNKIPMAANVMDNTV